MRTVSNKDTISKVLEMCTNATVLEAARIVAQTGAMSPSFWLENMPSDELAILLDEVHEEKAPPLTLISATLVLLIGTGEVLQEIDNLMMSTHCAYVRSLITFESLHRKGLINFRRDHISFDPTDDRELGERIHGIRDGTPP